jgi:hypothetical protein
MQPGGSGHILYVQALRGAMHTPVNNPMLTEGCPTRIQLKYTTNTT